MTSHHYRRTIAVLVSASLLASLTVATVASPVSAAKPRCQGFKATIVGTNKGEVIRGTARRDVIVARGGADRIYAKGGNDLVCAGPGDDVVFGGPGADTIWGQFGSDTLNGNAGPDFLAGQVGNDTLNGGIGVDTCFQGTGNGAVTRCERPAPPAAPVDTDGDGIPDSGDACPNQGGIIGGNGCPLDSDGDGVVDNDDACPNEGDRGWGVDASGCPNPPVTVTYGSRSAGTWFATLTWSGLEPETWLLARWMYGSTIATEVGYRSASGTNTFWFDTHCTDPGSGQPLTSATVTATEAGGTEKQYPMPLPDASICP